MNTVVEASDGVNPHPAFCRPLDTCLRVVFSEMGAKVKKNSINITHEIEISMRSHLLTITESLMDSCTKTSKTPDQSQEIVENEKYLSDLLEYLCSCLKFCKYILKHEDNPCLGQSSRDLKKIPFLLLEDTFDTIASRHIRTVWKKYVEDKSVLQILCGQLFFTQYSKLIFIRTCNKLIQRLSSHVEFSGRILMLLAAVFPVSERSAANVTGKFNIEKEVSFEDQNEWLHIQQVLQDYDTNMELSKPEKKKKMDIKDSLDYQFYKTFWGVQKLFSDPNSILGKWEYFETAINSILEAFEGNPFKEDHIRQLQSKWNQTLQQEDIILSNNDVENTAITRNTSDMDIDVTSHDQYARHHRYLTSSQLLHLQLRDPDIRIQFLTQLLIVCFHLMEMNSNNIIVNNSDNNEIKSGLSKVQERAETILANTPPNGKEHLRTLLWTLESNESIWRNWKANKCPPHEKYPKSPRHPTPKMRVPPLSRNPYIYSSDPLCQTSQSFASFHPSNLVDYFEEYADALDPEAGIEDEYHPKNNPVTCFRSLRLVKESFDLELLGKVRKSDGDLEHVVREIWKKEKGIDLPSHSPPNDDELSKEEVDEDIASVGSPMVDVGQEERKIKRMKEILKEDEEDLLTEGDRNEPSKKFEDSKESKSADDNISKDKDDIKIVASTPIMEKQKSDEKTSMETKNNHNMISDQKQNSSGPNFTGDVAEEVKLEKQKNISIQNVNLSKDGVVIENEAKISTEKMTQDLHTTNKKVDSETFKMQPNITEENKEVKNLNLPTPRNSATSVISSGANLDVVKEKANEMYNATVQSPSLKEQAGKDEKLASKSMPLLEFSSSTENNSKGIITPKNEANTVATTSKKEKGNDEELSSRSIKPAISNAKHVLTNITLNATENDSGKKGDTLENKNELKHINALNNDVTKTSKLGSQEVRNVENEPKESKLNLEAASNDSAKDVVLKKIPEACGTNTQMIRSTSQSKILVQPKKEEKIETSLASTDKSSISNSSSLQKIATAQTNPISRTIKFTSTFSNNSTGLGARKRNRDSSPTGQGIRTTRGGVRSQSNQGNLSKFDTDRSNYGIAPKGDDESISSSRKNLPSRGYSLSKGSNADENDYDEKGGRPDGDRNERGGFFTKRRRIDGRHSGRRENDTGRGDGRDGRMVQRDSGGGRGRNRRRGDNDRGGPVGRDVERSGGDGDGKSRRFPVRRRRN